MHACIISKSVTEQVQEHFLDKEAPDLQAW